MRPLIQAFPSGPLATNAYVVACPDTKQAAIIDPAPESPARIDAYLTRNQLTPKQILLTHSHWDHIAEAATLKQHYHIPVFVHPKDAGNLAVPGSDGLPFLIDIPGVQADGWLNDGDIISVGSLQFTIIHTPGHSPGCICLYCPTQNILLSGDTLFKGSFGNTSFPTSQPELMRTSLKKLSQLPQETLVYPGHGPKTTIRDEQWLHQVSH